MPRIARIDYDDNFASARAQILPAARLLIAKHHNQAIAVSRMIDETHSEAFLRDRISAHEREAEQLHNGQPFTGFQPRSAERDPPPMETTRFARYALTDGDELRSARLDHAIETVCGKNRTGSLDRFLGANRPAPERSQNLLHAIIVAGCVIDPDAGTWLAEYSRLAGCSWDGQPTASPRVWGRKHVCQMWGHEALGVLREACAFADPSKGAANDFDIEWKSAEAWAMAVPTLADALRDLADKLLGFSDGIDSNKPPDPLESGSGFRDLFALASHTLDHSHGPERQDREAIEDISGRLKKAKACYEEAWSKPVVCQLVTVKKSEHKGSKLRVPDARVRAAESLASALLPIAVALRERATMIDKRNPRTIGGVASAESHSSGSCDGPIDFTDITTIPARWVDSQMDTADTLRALGQQVRDFRARFNPREPEGHADAALFLQVSTERVLSGLRVRLDLRTCDGIKHEVVDPLKRFLDAMAEQIEPRYSIVRRGTPSEARIRVDDPHTKAADQLARDLDHAYSGALHEAVGIAARLSETAARAEAGSSGAMAPQEASPADQAFGAARAFVEHLGTLAYHARRYQPRPSKPDAWKNLGPTFASAFLAWFDLSHLLTPAVRTEARRVYPPGAPAIKLGKARPALTMIEAVADELGVFFRNVLYQDRRCPLDPDREKNEARATVLDRLGVKTRADAYMLMVSEWKAQGPARGESALSLLRCGSIDFDDLRTQLIREAEAVMATASKANAPTTAAADPSAMERVADRAADRAAAKVVEAMGARGDDNTPKPKLSELQPHDRQAWQLATLHTMTQEKVAAALNKEHGTLYTQGQVSRMIARAKSHADANGLSEKVAERIDRPRTVDPARLELGARIDKRTPRPSDMERVDDNDE